MVHRGGRMAAQPIRDAPTVKGAEWFRSTMDTECPFSLPHGVVVAAGSADSRCLAATVCFSPGMYASVC